ncbi:MAG: ABC transporter permease [Bryobacteraceae bacterium]
MTRAEITENLLVALDTLRSHKVRSTLTIVGIVIGVTSVISVASIIQGLNRFVQQKVESLGARTYFITRFPAGQDPNRMPLKYRLRKYINYSDAEYLRQACPDIETATTFGTRAFVLGQSNVIGYGAQRVERVFLRGAEPEYTQAIPQFTVGQGRFVSNYDEEHSRSVAVLGTDIADSLFPHADPLGKTVRINGDSFEVIGIFQPDSGLFAGFGVNTFVVMPLTTFRKYYPDSKELGIAFTVPKDGGVEKAKDEIAAAMRRRRHVPFHAENDFEVISPDFISSLWNQLTGALVILTGIISSVGLLVGGIGVMNIMLISVTERTSEIGVRKAIGARKADIRVQFLLEAILLTCVGGLIGILLGAIIAFAVRHLIPSIPASLSLLWVMLGVGISVAVGVFFGYYPANRAANLDPIVCLRYE